MKKYLLLLALPLVLVGCNENNDQAFLQPDQEFVEESDQNAVTDSTKEDDQSDAQVEENDQDQTSEQAQTADSDTQEDNSEDESQNTPDENQTSDEAVTSESDKDQDTETESDQANSATSSQSEPAQASAVQVSNAEENEDLAVKAVEDYVDYDLENYLYLVHPEENGDWVQVEVREQMPDQDHTNLIDLYRYNSGTDELEVFDFVEGTYLPVD